jgi:hypothetical protein
MPLSDFKNSVDILTVEGRESQEYVDRAAKAALISKSATGFDKAAICSLIKPSDIFDIEWHPIGPINSKKSYSYWILKESVKHFSSEFVLVVQADGFVVNKSCWKDEFLNYDYIGAPWPKDWPISEINRVGNGGFSIRSNKLMRLLSCLDYTEIDYSAEDKLISTSVDFLSSYGISFAPVELAAQFSLEWLCEEHKCPEKTFGFHDKHNDITKKYFASIL